MRGDTIIGLEVDVYCELDGVDTTMMVVDEHGGDVYLRKACPCVGQVELSTHEFNDYLLEM